MADRTGGLNRTDKRKEEGSAGMGDCGNSNVRFFLFEKAVDRSVAVCN